MAKSIYKVLSKAKYESRYTTWGFYYATSPTEAAAKGEKNAKAMLGNRYKTYGYKWKAIKENKSISELKKRWALFKVFK